MAIIRWRPDRDIWSLRDDMNELINSFFGRAGGPRTIPEGAWNPAVDVSETENAVYVSAEVPGLKKEDINISIQDNVLSFKGEKKQEKTRKDESLHCVERYYGSFHRSFSLPSQVDSSKVKATYKDGILTIELPKKEEAKPKEISISVD